MSLVTVTFVRHGESTDNLVSLHVSNFNIYSNLFKKTIWAGWADAPLSNHGMNQAKAAGAYFASTNTQFTVIYASPLKRAHATARAILSAHAEPKPSFTVSPDVREQHFGVAEGNQWSMKVDEGATREELYARGVYPVIYNRSEKFPGGESLDDLQARAERAIDELVIPHVWSAAQSGKKAHIAIVSHGLCISELIAALVRKDRDVQVGAHGGKWTGLMNTAWTRLTVDVVGLNGGQTVEVDPSDPPPLKVKVTHINEHSHLDKVKRQQGGIGSSAHDPAQTDIRAFFGGASVSSNETKSSRAGKPPAAELEEGRAASNAFDEVEVSTDGNGRP